MRVTKAKSGKAKSVRRAITAMHDESAIRRTLEYQEGYWAGFHGEAKAKDSEAYNKGYKEGQEDSK